MKKDIYEVVVSRRALRELKKMPLYIQIKLNAWIDDVGISGLQEVRKIKGFHDEPLKGNNKGKRSIRLSRSYRAIYTINMSNAIKFLKIVEVNHHEY